jgi:hypothetical protein
MSEEKHVQKFPPPDPDRPEPTFKQYLLGWGAIFIALVALGVLLGILMRILR